MAPRMQEHARQLDGQLRERLAPLRGGLGPQCRGHGAKGRLKEVSARYALRGVDDCVPKAGRLRLVRRGRIVLGEGLQHAARDGGLARGLGAVDDEIASRRGIGLIR